MRVAVIGSGISGLAATWYLGRTNEVTLYERGPNIGMDASSVELDFGNGVVHINAPMRVFFEAYYPTLCQLYGEVGAAYEPIKYSGSFSHRGDRAYFHYRNFWLGNSTLPFLSGRSLRLPTAWRLGLALVQLVGHVRKLDTKSLPDTLSLQEYLEQLGHSELGNRFLYPTFAGICTCSYEQVKAYPAAIILDYLARILTPSRVNRLTHGV
ncbi:MAG: FAD-dependent oxidoreductase [Pseudomonadota bacterium]